MSPATENLYQQIQALIDKADRADYRDLLEEIGGWVECLLDCLNEEDGDE